MGAHPADLNSAPVSFPLPQDAPLFGQCAAPCLWGPEVVAVPLPPLPWPPAGACQACASFTGQAPSPSSQFCHGFETRPWRNLWLCPPGSASLAVLWAHRWRPL